MFFPYADDPPRERRFPWINWLLIAVNCWVFFRFGGRPDYDYFVERWGFIPAQFDLVTMITSMFLHGSILHLLGNMWFLYLFGDNVENRIGPFKYLSAYLLCGLAGDLFQYAFFPNSEVPSVGASGAIFGIMGMYLYFFPGNRVRTFILLFIFPWWVEISAAWVIGFSFVLELLYARAQTLSGIEGGIGHLAHTGGFAAGAALAVLYQASGGVRTYGESIRDRLIGPVTDHAYDDDGRPHEGEDAGLFTKPHSDLRREIVALLDGGRIEQARRTWRRYAFDNHELVLPPREQLEIALALHRNGDRSAARDAYERLLKHYPNDQPYAAEANLALASILLQDFKETGDRRATPLIASLLQRAAESHPYRARRDLALRWLHALQGA